jgi:hypothetical protein
MLILSVLVVAMSIKSDLFCFLWIYLSVCGRFISFVVLTLDRSEGSSRNYRSLFCSLDSVVALSSLEVLSELIPNHLLLVNHLVNWSE